MTDDVSRDVCANCGRPRGEHKFGRAGAQCINGGMFALARVKRAPAEPPPETWKHTIIVFGTGEGPGIDEMLKTEQHAVIALDGTRSIARGEIIGGDE